MSYAECDSCGLRCEVEKLEAIIDMAERVDPGSEVPAGECPKCGALSYLVKGPRPPVVTSDDVGNLIISPPDSSNYADVIDDVDVEIKRVHQAVVEAQRGVNAAMMLLNSAQSSVGALAFRLRGLDTLHNASKRAKEFIE